MQEERLCVEVERKGKPEIGEGGLSLGSAVSFCLLGDFL